MATRCNILDQVPKVSLCIIDSMQVHVMDAFILISIPVL